MLLNEWTDQSMENVYFSVNPPLGERNKSIQKRERSRPPIIPALPVSSLRAELKNVRVHDATSIDVDFVLTNMTKTAICLPSISNSWGAYQWSFLVIDATGVKHELVNPQTMWWCNGFSTFRIAPQIENVLPCRLTANSGSDQDNRAGYTSDRMHLEFIEQRPDGSWSTRATPPKPWKFPIVIIGRFGAKQYQADRWNDHTNWVGSSDTNSVEVKAEKSAPLKLNVVAQTTEQK